ncbi:hypothetical protein GCM10025876_14940 [Demequina litorisediminis]|uniref:Uncharacterized protein n=1 Tax=Demequina litorisediminis TaxID=1849022 RepID=A0ABQ6IBX8_9MICO|nr:hypothetical protein GCM10025876_14940 [Demequina litorisediminis]
MPAMAPASTFSPYGRSFSSSTTAIEMPVAATAGRVRRAGTSTAMNISGTMNPICHAAGMTGPRIAPAAVPRIHTPVNGPETPRMNQRRRTGSGHASWVSTDTAAD